MVIWLLCMALLLLASAFFSASEAALFSLRKTTRGPVVELAGVHLIVARLLEKPERLLTAVLFWNLLVNLGYFTIGSIVSLQLQRSSPTKAGSFAVAALLVIIVFGEMLPKSLAVLKPESLGLWVARPLHVAVRMVEPLDGSFKMAALLSRRLLWPGFRPEPYLSVRDLERAVQLSGGDATLVEQEQRVLESIVLLSDIRAEELMRPRTQFQSFHPPVTLADLSARPFTGNFLLVTEADSEEIAGAIALDDLWRVPDGPLDRIVEPVIYVPWSTRAADVLELIRHGKREVAAVINEFGETIGILTFDDILDTIFSAAPSRSERLLRRALDPAGQSWRLARRRHDQPEAAFAVVPHRVARNEKCDDWRCVARNLAAYAGSGRRRAVRSLPLQGTRCAQARATDCRARSGCQGGTPAMIWWGIALGVAGVIMTAFFSGTETGFYRATRLRILLDALAGDMTARGLLFLTNHSALFVATALVGNSVAAYVISLATVIVVDDLLPKSTYVVELLAPIIVAPVVLVYGELLPKNLFLAAPNRLLRATGPLFMLFVALFFPLAGLLWLLGRFVGRLSGGSPEPVRLVLAQRELRQILAEGHDAGILHPAQQGLAHGIFAVARKPVKQFLTPLSQILIVRAGMSKQAVLRLAEQTRTAIVPVAAADGSNKLIGCVRVIDLRMRIGDDLSSLRPLPEVRDDATHLSALMRLESSGESLAQVVNQKGEAIGIVRLERLREPLF